jgi:hypothetical protein
VRSSRFAPRAPRSTVFGQIQILAIELGENSIFLTRSARAGAFLDL